MKWALFFTVNSLIIIREAETSLQKWLGSITCSIINVWYEFKCAYEMRISWNWADFQVYESGRDVLKVVKHFINIQKCAEENIRIIIICLWIIQFSTFQLLKDFSFHSTFCFTNCSRYFYSCFNLYSSFMLLRNLFSRIWIDHWWWN